MSEEIFKNHIGKTVKLFLSNGFKYEGKIRSSDGKVLTIFDERDKAERNIQISHVVDWTFSTGGLK